MSQSSSRDRGTKREIEPPWVAHPGYGPGDGFWRQSGELWWTSAWQPFWTSLGRRAQEEYLARWSVPEEWRKFHFDRAFQAWLDSVDEDD